MKTFKKYSHALLFVICIALLSSLAHSQNERNGIKLVLAISIDQFRYDYLTRFEKFYSDSGFKFIRKTGTDFPNAFYGHAVTVTGPGHATIMTGCYEGKNGIVLNNWYDRSKKKKIYCVEDTTVGFVDAIGLNKSGQRSPANLLVTSVGDELKSVSPDSKVVGVSIKDRAAVLMSGKKANAAYWFEDRTGTFVSSTFYMDKYPLWLNEYNHENQADRYFGKEWTKLLPDKAYAICDVDDAVYEADNYHLGKTFPHKITGGVSTVDRAYYKALCATPFSTDVLFDFTQQLLLGEQLGNRGVTDILNISVSDIDFIGHEYGPDSHEIMDACVRLDRQLAAFLKFIDGAVGLNNCLIVITSDHGVAQIPELLIKEKKDAGRIVVPQLIDAIQSELIKKFGVLSGKKKWIEAVEVPWLYINREALSEKKITLPEFDAVVKDAIISQKGIASVYTRQEIEFEKKNEAYFNAIKLSYNPQRAGDYFILVKPNYIFSDEHEVTGTSHGSPYEYDTHVPLLMRSAAVSKGTVRSKVGIADIAPTIAKCLNVSMPGQRDGSTLPVKISVVKKKDIKLKGAK